MSAYIVENSTINRIVTWISDEIEENIRLPLRYLAQKYEIDLDNIVWQAILASAMFQLNCDAVNVRYNEEHGPELAFEYESIHTSSRFQVFKSLQCWLYQCNEGDVDKTPLFKFFEEVKNSIAVDIATELPEYAKAKWA